VGLPFTTVQDLYTALRAVTDHSRPAYDAEIIGCLNFGYKEVIRTVASVRPEFFASFSNSFTLPPSTYEIDVSTLDPPLLRPIRLTATQSGRNTAILFRYRALHHQEYEASEMAQITGTFNVILYDVLQGRFPGTPGTVAATSTGNSITLVDATNFPPGTYVTLPGPPRTPLANVAETVQPGFTEPYYGVVMTRSPPGASGVITLAPPISPSWTTQNGTQIIPLRRQILRLANPPSQQQTGQLWYQYRPNRLVNLTEIIDPIVAEHQDMLLYYAIGQYLAAVNDTEAGSWLQKAQLLKSEAMQDIEPLSGQNSEALDSGLWGLG
jgi:hypothetical protein